MKHQCLFGLCIIVAVICSGCQLKKAGEVSPEGGKTVDIIKEEQRIKPEYKKIAEALLGMEWEECEKNGGEITTEEGASDNGDCTIERLDYTDKENELTVVTALDDPYCSAHMINYQYTKDNVGRAYENSLIGSREETCILNQLRAKYPSEEIDACTKEMALKKCESLVKAAGYENSTVTVYAMTEEALNMNYDDADGVGFGRPSEDYFESDTPARWKKEDEAMYMVYRPLRENVEVTGALHELDVIYSPKYERIVYVSGNIPFQEGTVVGSKSIVSEDAAKKAVMLERGVTKEENIVIDGIQFVYAIVPRETFLQEEHTLMPAWRVDFHLLNSAEHTGIKAYKTSFVDAVTGEPCKISLWEK